MAVFDYAEVEAWMVAIIQLDAGHRDYDIEVGGEICLTRLAEAAAAEFDQNHEGGPLDDQDHWIWGAARAAVEEA